MPVRKHQPISDQQQAQAIEKFMHFLTQFGPLPDEIKDFLLPHLKLRFFKKSNIISHIGSVSSSLYFVVSGLVCNHYILEDGEEITNWIVDESEIASIPQSLFTGRPSNDELWAVEDSLLVEIPYAPLREGFDRFSYLQNIKAAVMQHYIMRYDERCRLLRLPNAKDRLEQFARLYPSLQKKIPSFMIASYLGISRASIQRAKRP